VNEGELREWVDRYYPISMRGWGGRWLVITKENLLRVCMSHVAIHFCQEGWGYWDDGVTELM